MSEVTPQLAAQELLRRRRALAGMLPFREYMAGTGSREFEHPPARHHALIISKLEDLEAGRIERLLILAPPGSAKSTYCSIQFPLWWLAKRPNENILCASNSENLAENFNRRRRNLALTPEWSAVSGVKLAPDLQGVGHFGTTSEGGIRAAGVGSSIIGFRSALNVLDDPITGVDQALSSTQLEKQWDWFHSDFRTRLVPTGRELIVSTRWAKKDIAGRILDYVREGRENWTVLRLPMLCDSDNDPLDRKMGESLWPEYYGAAIIKEKQQNVLLWATQYQQTPLNESGSWIGNQHIEYEDYEPDGLHYIIAIDLALTVGRGDYTVFVVAGLDGDRKLHIVSVYRDRIDPAETVKFLFYLCDVYSPMECLIDDDSASKVLTKWMMEAGRREGLSPPPLYPMPLRGKDKETRATAVRALFLSCSVKIVKGPWNTALHKELLDFPAGDHDDQVDALGLIGRRYPFLSSPKAVRPPVDPYEGYAARLDEDGNTLMNVPLDDLFEQREERLARRSRRL